VFDYWNWGRQPDDPGLCNGSIDGPELADQSVVVFASHEHGDHYDPGIFGWRDTVSEITYVLGCQPEDEEAADYVFAAARQNLTVEGAGKASDVHITTLESNDSGVGFMVEVDGLVIFHPGDHANRQRDFSGPYKAEIDHMVAAGFKPDIAFLPISGCGFGDQEAVQLGAYYALEQLTPKVFMPMHSGGNSQRYREFVDDSQADFPQIQMIAVENDGDYFRYTKTEEAREAL
jgi:L-ascorbate metabolism protein UlaG (beta-lactamase superfamily)